jgi:hypothetical protein
MKDSGDGGVLEKTAKRKIPTEDPQGIEAKCFE